MSPNIIYSAENMSEEINQTQTPISSEEIHEVNKVMSALTPPKDLRCRLARHRDNVPVPAFQVRDDEGFVHKVVMYDNDPEVKVVNCSKYVSRSGLSFEFCLENRTDGLKETRGLWLVNEAGKTLRYRSESKIWHDINAVKFDYLPHWGRLIQVNNYMYEVFERAQKAPTLTLRKIDTQGHLFIYDFSMYSAYYSRYIDQRTIEKISEDSVYNHRLLFSTPVYIYRAHGGKLFVVTNETTLTLKSKDHGEKAVTLPVGVYLILHRPPRGKHLD